jgi:hypothetical protein
MKITTHSEEELELTDGSMGSTVGILIFVLGLFPYLVFALAEPRPPQPGDSQYAVPALIGMGLLVNSIGIAVILFSYTIVVNTNKTSGQIRYQWKRMANPFSETYAAADVLRIEKRKRLRSSPHSARIWLYQFVIVFKDGKERTLNHWHSCSIQGAGGSMVVRGREEPETAVAAQFATFLNVPFHEVTPSDGKRFGAS